MSNRRTENEVAIKAKDVANNPNHKNVGQLEEKANKFLSGANKSFERASGKLDKTLTQSEKRQDVINSSLDRVAGAVDDKEVDKLIANTTAEVVPKAPNTPPAKKQQLANNQAPQNNVPPPAPLDKKLADTKSFKDELDAISKTFKSTDKLAKVQQQDSGIDRLSKEQKDALWQAKKQQHQKFLSTLKGDEVSPEQSEAKDKSAKPADDSRKTTRSVAGIVIDANQKNDKIFEKPSKDIQPIKPDATKKEQPLGVVGKIINTIKTAFKSLKNAILNKTKLGKKVATTDKLQPATDKQKQVKAVGNFLSTTKGILENHQEKMQDIGARRKESVKKFRQNQNKTKGSNNSNSYKPDSTPPVASAKNNDISKS